MSSDPYVFGYNYEAVDSSLDWDDGDELPPTERSVIPPTILTIEDQYEPMFFTATWTPVAKVNGKIVSTPGYTSDQPHTPEFLKVWARNFIRNTRETLKSQGVDVHRAYVEWGGDVRDL